jgi:hypothetical protein
MIRRGYAHSGELTVIVDLPTKKASEALASEAFFVYDSSYFFSLR